MKVVHYVSKTDSVASVAKEYGCSEEELIKVNELKNFSLQGIVSLVIPQNDTNFIVVKNMDKEVLIEVDQNNLDRLSQLLKNKEFETSSVDGEFEEGDKIIVNYKNYKTHIVKPLQTLRQIANEFGVSMEYLVEKNALKTQRVFIGQKINI